MTLKQIAEMAGVSTATVSKVLNNKDENISAATRQKVLDVVEREGYVPNAIARSLKTNTTNSLGIIVPDVTNQFFSELARGVEDAAEDLGYTVILCNSDNQLSKEKKYLRVLHEKMVDGVILTPSKDSLKNPFNSRNMPMVLLDRELDGETNMGRIRIDNEEAIYKATSYLIEKSCKEIAYISADNLNRSTEKRFLGYKKALEENKLEYSEDLVYFDNYDVETGYEGTLKLLEKKKFDGICCGNDLIAIGAMRALREKAIDVPKDVKVIGLDDIQMSQYVYPALTTIKQPIYQMGKEAVDMLVAMINKKETKMEKVLETKLIERGSC